LKNSWNCEVRPNLITKACLTNNYFSRDPYFVILAWVQSWNAIEKLMKMWIEPEIFHKNMSNEKLLFTWSTFRDSSMGTKLKLFWITHQTGNPPNSFHKNMSHKQSHFTWSTFCYSSMGTKLKYYWITYETGISAWYFDKNISHEQIHFTRCTFRDSSMGTKLKYFWKTHETVKPARSFLTKTYLTNKYFSRDPHFMILVQVQN